MTSMTDEQVATFRKRYAKNRRDGESPECAFQWAATLCGFGYGVEEITDRYDGCRDWPRAEARYVNMGDTYDRTAILSGGRLTFGSWGDWVERSERRGVQFA